jgi:hypothetical protein
MRVHGVITGSYLGKVVSKLNVFRNINPYIFLLSGTCSKCCYAVLVSIYLMPQSGPSETTLKQPIAIYMQWVSGWKHKGSGACSPFKTGGSKLGMQVHACNPSYQELEIRGSCSEYGLSKSTRSYLKNK